MERNKDVWTDAKCTALQVGFLTTHEELFLYAEAIYSAMMWSMGVDEKNRAIREKDKSVK